MRRTYLTIALGLFSLLVAIAAFLKGGIVRTHGGDVVVVMWLYALGRAVTLWRPLLIAALVLVTAFAIEGGQAFAWIDRLGLSQSIAAQLALGQHFDPFDLLAYGLGVGAAYGVDRSRLAPRPKTV